MLYACERIIFLIPRSKFIKIHVSLDSPQTGVLKFLHRKISRREKMILIHGKKEIFYCKKIHGNKNKVLLRRVRVRLLALLTIAFQMEKLVIII
jgi:hypothetical protein